LSIGDDVGGSDAIGGVGASVGTVLGNSLLNDTVGSKVLEGGTVVTVVGGEEGTVVGRLVVGVLVGGAIVYVKLLLTVYHVVALKVDPIPNDTMAVVVGGDGGMRQVILSTSITVGFTTVTTPPPIRKPQ